MACSLMKYWPVCSRDMNCRGFNVSYVHCTPNPPHLHAPSVHAVSNTLYWSLAVFDLISSHTAATVSGLYTCRLCCYCNTVFIGLITACGHPWIACIVCCRHLPDSQHVIWCSPLAWCLTVALSPHQLSTSPLDYSIWHCVACIFSDCCQWLSVSSRINSKTSFRLLLPVLYYKIGSRLPYSIPNRESSQMSQQPFHILLASHSYLLYAELS